MLKKKKSRIILIVIGIVIAGTLVTTWLLKGQVPTYAKPYGQAIRDLGGTLICSNGDSGTGPDNATPWYTAYYSVPLSANVIQKVTSVASNQGITLHSDTDTVNVLQDGTNAHSQPYESANSYLTGSNANTNLALQVITTGPISLECGVKNYGALRTPASHSAIVEYTVTKQ